MFGSKFTALAKIAYKYCVQHSLTQYKIKIIVRMSYKETRKRSSNIANAFKMYLGTPLERADKENALVETT